MTDYVYSGSRMIAKVASGSTKYLLSDRLSTRVTLGSKVAPCWDVKRTCRSEKTSAQTGTQEKHVFTEQ